MGNIQLKNRIDFYICESFLEELRIVTQDYEYITINPYKAKCKYHNIKEPFIDFKESDTTTHIIGGCSVDKSTLKSNQHMIQESSCFNMFAPKAMIESYINNGAYIITPGWLNQWKYYVTKTWGFDESSAKSFFKEFCKKLILLDTLIDKEASKKLDSFASFVDREYEIIPVGIEYFKIYIENIIKSDEIEKYKKNTHTKLENALKDKANYAIAFDLVSRLNEKHEEKEIIDQIIEIFTMLFSPQSVRYLAINDSKIMESLSSQTSNIDDIFKLLDMKENYVLHENGFVLKLNYDNLTVGILSIENIAFVQYISQYINLAISISDVCALSIENSRSSLKQKKIEAQLTQHAKLASMGEMMGSIAHQWRQPLNALNLNIEMLEEYYEAQMIDEKFIEKFIEKNTNTVQFLSQTISDFSNFFKINKDKEHFSLKESILGTIEIIQIQLSNNNITYQINGDDIEVFGLVNEFKQVILNLVNNSKDAILQTNNSNGKIDINLYKEHGYAIISVKDNGGGMSETILDRVFEPYFTTKEQGKGIGMGLYISKMIIEDNMNGHLSVKNSEKGAVIKIKLELE